jgi:hypothetical protein
MRSMRFLLCAVMTVSVAGFVGATTARPAAPADSAQSTSTIYVSVSGPTAVATRWTCNWYAVVSGGTAPYTYHWSEQGMVREESYGNYWRGAATTPGTVFLNVLVTDATGQSAWGYVGIDSDGNGPFCMD